MRARSYHASPGEITSVGGCAQHLSMNCASTPDGGAVPGDVPGETLAAPTPGYQDRCRWLAGWREDPEGIASVPAPDSYPHVTCGCPVTARLRGVAAVAAPAAPGARHGCDEDTDTWAAASPPAPSNPAAAGRRSPALLPGISAVMTAPRVTRRARTSLWRRPGATTGRRPGARTTSPVRGREGGAVYRGDGGVALAMARLVFAGRRHQPATGTGRVGPDRSAARLADPLPAMASDPGWAEDRGVASARPAWARGPPRAVLVPVVSVLFPAPGRGLACPGAGPGKAVRAVR